MTADYSKITNEVIQHPAGDEARLKYQLGTGCGPDCGGEPDRRRGGQSADLVAADEDQSGADEADSGDDLAGHPRGVERDQAFGEDVAEPVLADDHEQRGAETDESVGTHRGGLLPQLPLHAATAAYNRGVIQQVAERWRSGKPVSIVPMHVLRTTPTDYYDAVHLNRCGYQKLAFVWYLYLRRSAALNPKGQPWPTGADPLRHAHCTR